MATNLVQFGDELVEIKRVYYTGSDTLRAGYSLCYDADSGTAASVDDDRAFNVEKPSTTNLNNYAGVVTDRHDNIAGPRYLEIYVPTARGQKVLVWTDASVVVDTTDLYLKAGSYAAGSSGSVKIGRAMQTVDRSSTNGTAQTLLITPLTSGVAAQDIGASASFTTAIWRNFPLAAMRANPALGTLVEYDPAKNPVGLPPWSVYTGAHNTVAKIAATSLAETDQLVLSQDASAADNDAVSVQLPGPIVISGSKPWAMEIAYDLVTITNADIESFVGLASLSTLSNVIPYQDGGAFTAAMDLIGFNVLVGDGNAIDASYQASGETTVVHDTGPGVPTANTKITVAMYYDGATIQVYVDGTNTADPITATDIADVTSDVFPAAATVYPTFAGKADSGVADGDDINVRAFRFAQLA